jgi:hypothetical protein
MGGVEKEADRALNGKRGCNLAEAIVFLHHDHSITLDAKPNRFLSDTKVIRIAGYA